MEKEEIDDSCIAILPAGLGFWLWFYKRNVTEKEGNFKGTYGWTNSNKTKVSITINETDIIGRIESDSPIY